MKSRVTIAAGLVFLLAPLVAGTASADPVECVKIQDGTLDYSAGHYLNGEGLTTGYDAFGYNYQAHLFNGSYANVYLGRDGFPPYGGDDTAYAQRLADEEYVTDPYLNWYWPFRDVSLGMKWDDDWLSNQDCDLDGSLDRYFGSASYIGSDAWETNHMWGEYEEAGETCEWDYFVKIVAAPSDATSTGGIWYASDGTEIGPAIWRDFAIVQQVENDACAGIEGLQYVSPDHAGFGGW